MMWGIDRRLIAVVVAAVLISFGLGYQYGNWTQSKKEAQAELLEQETGSEEKASGKCYVYVVGEVEKPGVLEMQEGDRVFKALEKVVPGAEADLTSINLAAPITDGQQIVVPRVGQTLMTSSGGNGAVNISSGSSSGGGGLLNINSASVEELDDRLPGIGPALAQRIVDYRLQNGGFKTIEQIKEVSGIGDKRFTEMKDLICVR